ncbi:MAG: pentapeptide repeat-containing protein [Cyanobacteria bacterium P01_A01_bin.83]
MTSGKPNITLHLQAKAGLKSLFVQTAQVSLGLIILLVATRGNPPRWLVYAGFFFGVGFVAWSENKRQSKFEDQIKSHSNNEPENQSLPLGDSKVIEETIVDLFDDSITKKLFHTSDKSTNISGRQIYDQNQYCRLQEGVNVWNYWKLEHRHIKPTLSCVNLSGLNISGANLKSADLSGADLSGANLSGTYLRSADLSGADLKSAFLFGVNLSGADLSGADLRSANLFGAIVDQARFGNNLGIDDQLKQDLIDRGAIFVDSPEDPAKVRSPVPR